MQNVMQYIFRNIRLVLILAVFANTTICFGQQERNKHAIHLSLEGSLIHLMYERITTNHVGDWWGIPEKTTLPSFRADISYSHKWFQIGMMARPYFFVSGHVGHSLKTAKGAFLNSMFLFTPKINNTRATIGAGIQYVTHQKISLFAGYSYVIQEYLQVEGNSTNNRFIELGIGYRFNLLQR